MTEYINTKFISRTLVYVVPTWSFVNPNWVIYKVSFPPGVETADFAVILSCIKYSDGLKCAKHEWICGGHINVSIIELNNTLIYVSGGLVGGKNWQAKPRFIWQDFYMRFFPLYLDHGASQCHCSFNWWIDSCYMPSSLSLSRSCDFISVTTICWRLQVGSMWLSSDVIWVRVPTKVSPLQLPMWYIYFCFVKNSCLDNCKSTLNTNKCLQ